MKNLATFIFLTFFYCSHSQTFQNGLIAHYKLDGNAVNATSNSNHGIVHGAIPTTDRFGNLNSAYSFDGTDDIIRIPNFNNGIEPAQDAISVSFWVKTLTAKTSGIIGSGTACNGISTDEYLVIGMSYLGNYKDVIAFFANQRPILAVDDTPVLDKNWHFIVYVYELGTSKIYIDGQLKGSKTVGHPPTNVYNAEVDWTIGGFHSNNCSHNPHFHGYIDDVSIYNRKLLDKEITQLYSLNSSSEINFSFQEENLKINPIPAIDQLNIDFVFEGQKNLTLQIINALGQVVVEDGYLNQINQLNIKLNIDQLTSGIYFVQIIEKKEGKAIGEISKKILVL